MDKEGASVFDEIGHASSSSPSSSLTSAPKTSEIQNTRGGDKSAESMLKGVESKLEGVESKLGEGELNLEGVESKLGEGEIGLRRNLLEKEGTGTGEGEGERKTKKHKRKSKYRNFIRTAMGKNATERDQRKKERRDQKRLKKKIKQQACIAPKLQRL